MNAVGITLHSHAVEVVVIDADDLARRGLADFILRDDRFTLGRDAAIPSDVPPFVHASLVIFDPLSRDRADPSWFMEVRTRAVNAGLVVFTSRIDSTLLVQALDVGSSGYFIKGQISGAALLDALHLIATSSCVVADGSIRAFLRGNQVTPRLSGAPFTHLTERELQILRLIAEGLHDEEVAEQLRIQPSTVESHISRMREKLGAAHRAHLVVLAHRLGVL